MPDRVETKLTKAVGQVQDVASSLVNAFDFCNMPDSIVGADTDTQSAVVLCKGVIKVAEFAGGSLGPIIKPAANAIANKARTDT